MCHLVHFAMVAKMFVTWFVSKFIHWLNVGPLAKSVPNNPNYPKQLGRARFLGTYSKSQPELFGRVSVLFLIASHVSPRLHEIQYVVEFQEEVSTTV